MAIIYQKVMAGLGVMKDGKRKPRAGVMRAIGVTHKNTYKTFAKKFASAAGPRRGRPLMAPIPMSQVDPDLRRALNLKKATPYPRMMKMAYAK